MGAVFDPGKPQRDAQKAADKAAKANIKRQDALVFDVRKKYGIFDESLAPTLQAPSRDSFIRRAATRSGDPRVNGSGRSGATTSTFDQAGYDAAMADYQSKLAEREKQRAEAGQTKSRLAQVGGRVQSDVEQTGANAAQGGRADDIMSARANAAVMGNAAGSSYIKNRARILESYYTNRGLAAQQGVQAKQAYDDRLTSDRAKTEQMIRGDQVVDTSGMLADAAMLGNTQSLANTLGYGLTNAANLYAGHRLSQAYGMRGFA